MRQPVISVRNLSKAYPLYESPGAMLRELLFSRQQHNKFWALKDISFDIPEKSRVGIIGPNGSGKSTLLRIIAGNLQPTDGHVEVRGEISGMLSLNSVLNQEETGLSNIRFNLLVNGCSRDSLDLLTEEIIDFTELGQFIYAPVKTYSAGMNARLAFAIATAIEPEIMIVDEVLSVGDAYFVGKAMQRMVELCDRGKALLFVSHAIDDVQRLCDTIIWLEDGMVRNIGPSEYIASLYEEDYRRREDEAIREKNRLRSAEASYQTATLFNGEEISVFRLVSSSKATFADTHYVRSLSYAARDKEEQNAITLGVDSSDGGARIERFGSEWGRLFDWRGVRCRMLEARSGRDLGGNFSIPMPLDLGSGRPINIFVSYRSRGFAESLAVEAFDYGTAEWTRLETIEEIAEEEGWKCLKVKGHLRPATAAQITNAHNIVKERAKPLVEIVEIDMLCHGKSTRVLTERQPFQIAVTANAKQDTTICDIHLKIMRSDGVYVFWQSSGMTGTNLENFTGKRKVYFEFDTNSIGAGEYLVTVAATNGWRYPENYPQTECFDRKVGALEFKIQRETIGLDLGVVNMQVPTRFENED